jgi:bifunctional non-homologous end joining protein LigD
LSVAVPLHLAAVSEFSFIPPCSPVTAKSVPAGDGWLHEPKLDGYRLQVSKHGRMLRLYSRRGHDWGKRLTALVEHLWGIPAHSVVFDAELCFPGPDGAPDFFRLLKAAFSNRGSELVVYAFDLLHLNGRDLTALPLIERRQLLERLLSRAKVDCLHLVDAFTDGQRLLEAAEQHGLEGVVSKRKTAPYRSGECDDWVKVKTVAWREANRERWRLFERKKAGALRGHQP